MPSSRDLVASGLVSSSRFPPHDHTQEGGSGEGLGVIVDGVSGVYLPALWKGLT